MPRRPLRLRSIAVTVVATLGGALPLPAAEQARVRRVGQRFSEAR